MSWLSNNTDEKRVRRAVRKCKVTFTASQVCTRTKLEYVLVHNVLKIMIEAGEVIRALDMGITVYKKVEVR